VWRTNFSADFWTFRNFFYRNLAKIVAPPSDECENYVACLKAQSIPKKMLQTASKLAYKWQRNACSNYAPLERTVLRTQSVTNKQKNKKTPHFRTYSLFDVGYRALYDLPQTLHGDRARRGHHKSVKGLVHFSIQRIVFPTGCTEKYGIIYRCAVSPQ